MNTGSITAESGAARFSRHVAWTLAARIFVAGGSLLAGVIVARWLGAASVGVLASLSVMTTLAVNFGAFGLSSAITYLIAREHKSLRAVMFNALIFALAAGGVLATAIIGVAVVRPGFFGDVPAQLVITIAVAIPFHMLSLFCLAMFLGLGRIGYYNLLDILSPALLVLNPIIVLVVLGMGLAVLVTINTASTVLLGFLVLGLLLRQGRVDGGPARPDLRLMEEMLRYGSKFYIAMAAGLIILRADLLIVNYFRGAEEAGVYAVATQVGTLLMLVPSVISTVLFPRVTEARDPSGEMTCRVTRHTAFLMLGVCMASVPLAFLLPVLYGPAFAPVPFQVLILLPGVYLFGIEAVQVQYFNSLGLPRAIPIFWIVTLVFNLALNLLLVPLFGANAAAAVSSMSYMLMFFLVAIYFRSQTHCSISQTFVLRGDELRDLFGSLKLSIAGRKV
jgi:O-antigen/teichoic acid export membrane protein